MQNKFQKAEIATGLLDVLKKTLADHEEQLKALAKREDDAKAKKAPKGLKKNGAQGYGAGATPAGPAASAPMFKFDDALEKRMGEMCKAGMSPEGQPLAGTNIPPRVPGGGKGAGTKLPGLTPPKAAAPIGKAVSAVRNMHGPAVGGAGSTLAPSPAANDNAQGNAAADLKADKVAGGVGFLNNLRAKFFGAGNKTWNALTGTGPASPQRAMQTMGTRMALTEKDPMLGGHPPTKPNPNGPNKPATPHNGSPAPKKPASK